MNLEEKLKKQQYKEIWQAKYCGFLDLSMDGYMKIQRRLMEEQVKLWSNCGLGQSILKGKHPKNLDEFRKMVPLTTYDDYADILLAKQPDMLPGNPVSLDSDNLGGWKTSDQGCLNPDDRIPRKHIRLLGKQNICIIIISCQRHHFSELVQIFWMLSF